MTYINNDIFTNINRMQSGIINNVTIIPTKLFQGNTFENFQLQLSQEEMFGMINFIMEVADTISIFELQGYEWNDIYREFQKKSVLLHDEEVDEHRNQRFHSELKSRHWKVQFREKRYKQIISIFMDYDPHLFIKGFLAPFKWYNVDSKSLISDLIVIDKTTGGVSEITL